MFGLFKKPQATQDQEPELLPQTNRYVIPKQTREAVIDSALQAAFPVKPIAGKNAGATMDFFDSSAAVGNNFGTGVSDTHIRWFGSHSFIGYQTCAIFAQHWLIDNACQIPVDDSLRKGWKITKNDGEEIDTKTLATITQLDKRFNIQNKARDFAKFGRVYGVRVAVFNVDSPDKDYYELPFNPDGVKPGSYKGITMNDPYYTIPLLTQDSQNPNSSNFYEPEFWVIGGKKYHKSHCVVFRHSEVPQILKPSYIYGGISLTQQIFEAAYNAEVTSGEIPQLVQNMRTYIYKMDLSQVAADPIGFEERLGTISEVRNNHGIQAIGLGDELTQIQTTLTGLDEIVIGRYQICAAVAQMPLAKLMKTDLTGGLVKGGGEESIYHETLESLQAKILPFMERHYQLLSISEQLTDNGIDVVFNKLDAMT